MTTKVFIFKLRARLWFYLVSFTRDSRVYPYIYGSYWHYLFHRMNTKSNNSCYYGARPNPGAGIGHQMANWIAGYWFAKQFGLKFAHFPFFQSSWERFLGFADNEKTAQELLEKQGYKKVLLPLFDEFNDKEIKLVKKIIASYTNQNVVFVPEQDQGYRDQFGVMNEIKDKFYKAKARENDILSYSEDNFNIAIHIRRGDIVKGQVNNEQYKFRWQSTEYFETVLSNVVEKFKSKKPIAIYLFSQGDRKDFSNFERFENIHFCLDMGAQDSFLHMVYADLLITSRSSFSYKPALLNNGIKVCPKDFWHGYPNSKDWILIDENGTLDSETVDNLL